MLRLLVPETFRLYEALEMGAIPITVRQDPRMNFMRTSPMLWQDYPAPQLLTFTHMTSFVDEFLYYLR
jgi:hypothetical protein